MKLFDLQQEVYRPLWLRVAITVACLGWAAVEFASGAPFWGVLFAAIGAYAGHQFFIAFDPKAPDERDGKE
ncbi:MAG TPA: DUF3329 domain-containing protein [Paracoccus sp. (in: a-proteobacteria)]|uniref:DUF3329 domain-containing protein n=1 Tax=uncultured Paracoccus sp. TaxID=189685 RepID=UPI002622AD74|nr:DUF3329 domain-containing protein [uncultured Paracoccus sp.]HMQ41535.1 DUF3329 domain-containing protein [Paracoccus sp. (in: a-proteobacteria)]HMR35468.1 DUF3329 domain-containing protein [Paracoccus sp. (in: a-proteobacteria)]